MGSDLGSVCHSLNFLCVDYSPHAGRTVFQSYMHKCPAHCRLLGQKHCRRLLYRAVPVSPLLLLNRSIHRPCQAFRDLDCNRRHHVWQKPYIAFMAAVVAATVLLAVFDSPMGEHVCHPESKPPWIRSARMPCLPVLFKADPISVPLGAAERTIPQHVTASTGSITPIVDIPRAKAPE